MRERMGGENLSPLAMKTGVTRGSAGFTLGDEPGLSRRFAKNPGYFLTQDFRAFEGIWKNLREGGLRGIRSSVVLATFFFGREGVSNTNNS